MHGDEPAGPWALLSLVRDGLLDRSFATGLWPCANPSGYAAGTRANAEGLDINRSFGGGGSTPEARAILTANRDRQFALSIDLHEDPEAQGFYCYELSEPAGLEPDRPGLHSRGRGSRLSHRGVRTGLRSGLPARTRGLGPHRARTRLDRGRRRIPGLRQVTALQPGALATARDAAHLDLRNAAPAAVVRAYRDAPDRRRDCAGTVARAGATERGVRQ
jgi:hypothetical protein